MEIGGHDPAPGREGVGLADSHVSREAPFSARETEVLRMIAEGMTNRQIAARLHVTVHAVKFHLSSIYRKLGVENRTEAAVAFVNASGASRTDA